MTPTHHSYSQKALEEFWPRQQAKIDQMTVGSYREVNRHSELPIARIKKIMKIEEGVKSQMISAEAPVLLAKAAELFIEELTLRSWLNTHENRRKTIQKADVSSGASKSEMFDFLIDILPRDEAQNREEESNEYEEAIIEDEAVEQPQSVQYIFQYADGVESPLGDRLEEPTVMRLGDGQIIQATQIGQPIPISAQDMGDAANRLGGQPIMMALPTTMAMGDSQQQQQFHIVHALPNNDNS